MQSPKDHSALIAADRAEVRLEESQQKETPPPPADIVERYAASIRAAIRKALEEMARDDALRLIAALHNELREIEAKWLDGKHSFAMSETPELRRRSA